MMFSNLSDVLAYLKDIYPPDSGCADIPADLPDGLALL
jgi:hypothetical protein